VKRVFTFILAALLVGAGCRRQPSPPPGPRPRVVSFSPALTDIVFDMGLGGHVVGVTNYCVLPPGQTRPALGDRINVSLEAILSVEPDVLLIQQDPGSLAALREVNPKIRIVSFQIETLQDIISAVDGIGQALGKQQQAEQFKQRFLGRLESVRRRQGGGSRPRVLFVLGYGTPVVARDRNFIHDLIELAGGANAGAEIRGLQRWQQVPLESILAAAPDVLICQVEPAQEAAARKFWLDMQDLPAARSGRVFIVTDRRWSIPSTRVAELAEKMWEMLHAASKGAGGGDG